MSGPSGHPGQAPDPADADVYHVELRQFPHNVCRFNLTERELQATVVERWAQEQWIEVGERKWSPHQAKLTVLRGPRIPLEQLSMGRGWRAAQRDGRDVTAHVMTAAREAADDGRQAQTIPAVGTPSVPFGAGPLPPSGEVPSSSGRAAPPPNEGLVADSLGLDLLVVLGAGRAPLRRAWELAGERHPERTAGQCLVLAERAVASLLRSRLIVLDWGAGDADDIQGPAGDEQVQAVLRSIDSWGSGRTSGEGGASNSVWICRA